MSVQIISGHWVDGLRSLRAGSIHCAVTSPPYWGLRSYLPAGHPLKALELGSEPTLAEYVAKMVDGFEEVRRVLRDDGTLWLNLGDTYANDTKWGGSTGGKHVAALHGGDSTIGRAKRVSGLKPKDLCGVPWRVAFALQDAGWYLRSDIVWEKPTAMPEAVTDRPTKSHEYVFLLSKSPRYFYDAEAIKEPVTGGARPRGNPNSPKAVAAGADVKANASFGAACGGLVDRRNKRSVWTIKAGHYDGAHYATFPPELVRPCILAGTSERGCCPECGAPWEREMEKSGERSTGGGARKRLSAPAAEPGHPFGQASTFRTGRYALYETTGWAPTCSCDAGAPVPATVLDPFGGSGTTGEEAERLGRHSILIELDPQSVALAVERTAQTGLFAAAGSP